MGLGLFSTFGYIQNINKDKIILSEEIIKLENNLNEQEKVILLLEDDFSNQTTQCQLGKVNTQNIIKDLKTQQVNKILNLQKALDLQQQKVAALINENLLMTDENNRLKKQIADFQSNQSVPSIAIIKDNDVVDLPETQLSNLENKPFFVSSEVVTDFNLPEIIKPKNFR